MGEPVIASVTVGSNVRLALPNSILHVSITADVVAAEEKVCSQEQRLVCSCVMLLIYSMYSVNLRTQGLRWLYLLPLR